MKIVYIKGLVASNIITNAVAEWILQKYTIIRKKITGSYTKNKEEITVLNILKQCINKPINEIKYIDIGANHYRRGNNTYLFYEHGARGILIEADPLLCKKLKKHRNKDKILNIAIGINDGECVPFYILSLPTRSSMDKQHVKESIKSGLSISKVIDIPCRNLNILLEELCFEPDFLSIDIEGMDYKVLRTIDFVKYRIKVIIAEKTNELNENGESMDIYMEKQGYEVYGHYGSNVIYQLKNVKFQL